MRHPFLMAAALFAASHWSAPLARGQDYCWDPIQVADTGSWTLDNTNANPSGFMGCGMNMWRDVVYQWTVPRTGGYVFETCGTVGDTIMALYSGEGCTATCLRFNDDYCGTSSQIQFGQLTQGDRVLIQVGAKDFQTDIVGEFTIRCATASPVLSSSLTTGAPSSSSSRGAIGSTRIESTTCPLGRPKWHRHTGRVPRVSSSRRVGREARIRVSSVMRPSGSTGTLKSTRTRMVRPSTGRAASDRRLRVMT